MKPVHISGALDLSAPDIVIRPASKADQDDLDTLISSGGYVHRHLDWRSAIDWLGYQPFWVLQKNRRLLAALACLPDPPETTWVRLFAASNRMDPFEAWQVLFAKILQSDELAQSDRIAALALQTWFEEIILRSSFTRHQNIVVLAWKGTHIVRPRPIPAGVSLRPMRADDLEIVQKLDEIAFDPLWRISLGALTRAFRQSAYATVAQSAGEIIGYQLSTSTPFSAHLARLAVHPRHQRKNIGYALVQDFLEFTQANDLWHATVNTQNDNYASLALYERIGFHATSETFPVFLLHLKPSASQPAGHIPAG